MAMHSYTNCTGYVYTGGTLAGYIQGDFTFEKETGKYVVQGTDVATAHTRGMRRVSGHVQRAWGMTSSHLYDWINDDEEKLVVFYPVAGSSLTYTASGCVLTNLRGSITAGSADVLVLDADFEGLDWSSGDT
jgi:hypothetical protein